MKFFIYSTLAAAVTYLNHSKGGGDLPVAEGEGVLIHGGTGVFNSNQLVTPLGVVTEVTAEQLEYLQRNEVYKLHKQNGFIVESDSKKDPERVVGEGMEAGDGSRQLVTEDFTTGDDTEPKPSTSEDNKTAAKAGKSKK